jgi:hypothetical protein
MGAEGRIMLLLAHFTPARAGGIDLAPDGAADGAAVAAAGIHSKNDEKRIKSAPEGAPVMLAYLTICDSSPLA